MKKPRIRATAFVIMLMMLCALMLCSCGQPVAEMPPADDDVDTDRHLRSTVLYFEDDSGNIVPVMKKIPWEEGIGCAALSYLVRTAENISAAAEMGLNPTVPAGTEFALKINPDKKAVLNVINLPAYEDKEQGAKMLTSMVNTLTEFPTIDSVTVLLDGEPAQTLPCGTLLSSDMSAFLLNVENSDMPVMASGEVQHMTFYVPSRTCSTYVPITRIASESSFSAAVAAVLDKAEVCDSVGKASLISATISGGTAVVNVTDELLTLDSYSDGALCALYTALYLTANEYADVSELKLYVEGEAYSSDAFPVSAPVYANTWKNR